MNGKTLTKEMLSSHLSKHEGKAKNPPPPQEPKPEKKKTNWWDIGMGALQVVGGAAEVIAGVTTAVFTAPSVGGALLGAYMAVDGFYTMKSGVAQMMNGYYGEERYDTSHGLEEAFASAGALVGNEQLGRDIYMAASLVNPGNSRGKLKVGIKAAEAVGDAGKKVKRAEKGVGATQSFPKLTEPAAGDNIGVSLRSKGKGNLDCPECTISRSKYPESAQHIEDAIKNGQPDILTINRGGAKSNRRDSLKGLKKVQSKDLDEYPPAMFKEGGSGASVRPISPSDNRGAGSSMGHQLRQYPDGTKIRIKIDD
jgi:hypothetical protein